MMQQGRPRLVLSSIVFLTLLAATLLAGALEQGADSKPEMSFGFEIQTPTAGVDFTGFMRDLSKSVRQNWFASMPEDALLGRKGKVVVKFEIKNDGKLADGSLIVMESSGRKDLDGAAFSAIKSSAPFKGFPKEFPGPAIELRFIFLYNLPLKDRK